MIEILSIRDRSTETDLFEIEFGNSLSKSCKKWMAVHRERNEMTDWNKSERLGKDVSFRNTEFKPQQNG